MPVFNLSHKLRKYRESKKLPPQQVAATLDLDTAVLCKFECGERKFTNKNGFVFAKYYNMNANELLLAWLSDKITGKLQGKALAINALKVGGRSTRK